MEYRIGCILMAAGNATRFESNKLLAEFNGRTVFERALDAIPQEQLYRVAVITQYQKLSEIARKRGFKTVINEYPEAGLSHTIALGIGAMQGADALMFMVADQPLLRKQSVMNVLSLHRANPDRIVSLAYANNRGNPCVFPREFFPALFALSGDEGGSRVINENEQRLLLSYAQDGRELVDIDTQEDLQALIR